ncbi:hypothetical protein GGX14DRAFT_577435 [Mycena pura]|uniref:Uncharacterized protein n=1 Tax=Mycena pura TaxID=153505 RepID=A0AAD6URR1_9AGAR|nr:hypothetical protein GGX14DRAFT_577435 [Mycena pura]
MTERKVVRFDVTLVALSSLPPSPSPSSPENSLLKAVSSRCRLFLSQPLRLPPADIHSPQNIVTSGRQFFPKSSTCPEYFRQCSMHPCRVPSGVPPGVCARDLRLSTLLNHPDCLSYAVAAARPQILSRAAHAFCVGPLYAALKEHARYGFAAYPGLRIDATDNASRSKYHRLQYHHRQRLRPRVQPEHRQRNASAGADGAEHVHSPPETRPGSAYGSYKHDLLRAVPLPPPFSVHARTQPSHAVTRPTQADTALVAQTRRAACRPPPTEQTAPNAAQTAYAAHKPTPTPTCRHAWSTARAPATPVPTSWSILLSAASGASPAHRIFSRLMLPSQGGLSVHHRRSTCANAYFEAPLVMCMLPVRVHDAAARGPASHSARAARRHVPPPCVRAPHVRGGRQAGDIAAVVCAHYRTGAAEAAKDVRTLRAAEGRSHSSLLLAAHDPPPAANCSMRGNIDSHVLQFIN